MVGSQHTAPLGLLSPQTEEQALVTCSPTTPMLLSLRGGGGLTSHAQEEQWALASPARWLRQMNSRRWGLLPFTPIVGDFGKVRPTVAAAAAEAGLAQLRRRSWKLGLACPAS